MTRRDPPGRPRRTLWWDVLVAGVLAMVALLVGMAGHLDASQYVLANGVPVAVPPGTSLYDLVPDSALLARDGARLDVVGDVFLPRGGRPGRRSIDGVEVEGNPALHDGAQVLVQRGADAAERLARKKESIPYDTTIEGSGPVVSVKVKGKPGEQEVFSGELSKRRAAVFVLSEPVAGVMQRSHALSPGQKAAALTFDDGPGAFTQPVLDVLASKNVPGTFFVLGSNAASNLGMIKKIKAAGHEVENHTWSHPILTKLSSDAVSREITRTNEAIGGARFLRPPYGTYDARVAADAGALGMRLVLWTVDTRDWEVPKVEAIMSKVKAETGPGAIILMHDGGNDRAATVAALPHVIDWLFSQGYALTTVGHLLGD